MEDLETLKKILKREEEFNTRYGKGNWRPRTVTSTKDGKRVTLPLTKELEHLGVQGGDTVIVGLSERDGKPVIIVEKL